MGRLALALALSVALTVPVSAGAQSLGYVSEVIVYDFTGKKVGAVWPHYGRPAVELRLGSRPVILEVTRGRLEGNSGVNGVLYRSADCTGQAFVWAWKPILPITHVIGRRQTLFVQAGGKAERSIRSLREDDGTCVVFDSPQITEAVPVDPVVDLRDHFTPPFSIRARGTEDVPVTAPHEGTRRRARRRRRCRHRTDAAGARPGNVVPRRRARRI